MIETLCGEGLLRNDVWQQGREGQLRTSLTITSGDGFTPGNSTLLLVLPLEISSQAKARMLGNKMSLPLKGWSGLGWGRIMTQDLTSVCTLGSQSMIV